LVPDAAILTKAEAFDFVRRLRFVFFFPLIVTP
jgi:hypothetical protein